MFFVKFFNQTKYMSGSAKGYSVSKVPQGLLTLTKDHYNEATDTFVRLQSETYNDEKLNQIIQDFPKFETVILLTTNVFHFV